MSEARAPHPRDTEAAEYVVGTLSPAERESFARELDRDPALLAAVRAWEERLAPLAEAVPPVEPGPSLWGSLLRAVAPEATPPTGDVLPFAAAGEIRRLRRSRAIWQGATAAIASLAAALALYIAVDRGAPGPQPGLVAVVNRSGDLPALIVRVDPRAGTVQVRELAAETPTDRSLELWSIVGGGAPRSLGLVAPGPTRVAIPPDDRARLDGATIAVTVEPRGGSPTGGPTGAVVYSGRLVSEAP